MSEIQIRRAQEADDAAIGELLVRSFTSQYAKKMPEVVTSEYRLRELRDVATRRAQGVVLVAEQLGAIVGTVGLYPPGAPKSEAWLPNAADLRQLAVAEGQYGKGLAARLLDAAERIAWDWGVEAVCLHTRRGADGVARMYGARGYAFEPAGDVQYPHVYLVAQVLRRSALAEQPGK